MDGVDLTFDKAALDAIAEISLKRKTGARGLRSIMESIMTDVMYRVPSDSSITACRITKDVVLGKAEPVLTHKGDADAVAGESA